MSRKRSKKAPKVQAPEAIVEEEILAEGSGPVAVAPEVSDEELAAVAGVDESGDIASFEAADHPEPVELGELGEREPSDAELDQIEAGGIAALDAIDAAAEPMPEMAAEAGDGEPVAEGEVAADGEGATLPVAAAAMVASELKKLVEALVFASDKPVTVQRLRQLTRVADTKRLEATLAELQSDYSERGLILTSVSGGWQFRTRPQFSAWVQQLIAGRPVRLSRAQLETLAIIAYRQPITRPEIDDIRGVDSSATLKLLLDRTLIRVLGKKEEVGRPMLYGTTKEFLDFFSLGDLRELPTLREYSELSDESRRVMSDRLGIDPDAEMSSDAADSGGSGDSGDAGDGATAEAEEPESMESFIASSMESIDSVEASASVDSSDSSDTVDSTTDASMQSIETTDASDATDAAVDAVAVAVDAVSDAVDAVAEAAEAASVETIDAIEVVDAASSESARDELASDMDASADASEDAAVDASETAHADADASETAHADADASETAHADASASASADVSSNVSADTHGAVDSIEMLDAHASDDVIETLDAHASDDVIETVDAHASVDVIETLDAHASDDVVETLDAQTDDADLDAPDSHTLSRLAERILAEDAAREEEPRIDVDAMPGVRADANDSAELAGEPLITDDIVDGDDSDADFGANEPD